ncbi:carotenoid oxygenase family protein [Nocardia iowensis]|uniref:Dioxygenase n=1 Tax=Nocardia iowensis TaxID=204891 RepID=A0ABX8RMQ8_NOCIO|nr:carotenoid oxygenase family protein [Nocardia iowensis]QXN88681.1 carotenoid oxygenase family protein [Nocardia iowensis]
MSLSLTSTTKVHYNRGLLEPIGEELTLTELQVVGAIPPELTGRYFRNGIDPVPEMDPGHAFLCPGMIHGIRLRDGRAEWYRNRYVRTPAFGHKAKLAFDADGNQLHEYAANNTDVKVHAGRILSLSEQTPPYEMSPDLDTVGPWTFGGKLRGNFIAHPKLDPHTGDLHSFGYDMVRPLIDYYVIDAAGELTTDVRFEIEAPTFLHDMALTENYVLVFQTPATYDVRLLDRNPYPIVWNDEHPCRIGLLPRHGSAADIIWLPISPCWIVHTANAYEDAAGHIVVEATRVDAADWDRGWAGLGGLVAHQHTIGPSTELVLEACLYRWTIDPVTYTVREEFVDDRVVEFPAINQHHNTARFRYTYIVGYAGHGRTATSLVKYDHSTGAAQTRDFPPGQVPGEPEFVPAPGAGNEDDGWILSLVTGLDGQPSELAILDAADFTGPAAARIMLPHRVPYGFHGSWIPDSALGIS